MTTQDDEKASADAANLATKAQEAGSPEGTPAAEPAEAPEPSISDVMGSIKSMQTTMASNQGRDAQRNGMANKQLDALATQMTTLATTVEGLQRRQVDQLPEDEQLAYYKEREAQQANVQPQQPQEAYVPTPEEEQVGREAAIDASAYMQGKGITDVQTNDSRIWQGYRQGMTVEQLQQVARGNIDKLASERQSATPAAGPTPPAPAPPTPETQAGPVPPTTQGTPIQTPVTFDSMSELARARAEGRWKGTSDEYNVLATGLRG